MLKKHDIHINILQLKIIGYIQYKCNCSKDQGVMTLIRNDTQAEVKNNNNDADIDIQVYNLYCPPSSNAKIDIHLPYHSRTIIAGDFNAHTPALGYPSYNNRGKPRGHCQLNESATNTK